ncbi:MAG TPA: hypothetical protein VMR34_03450 [Candidatus Saccharimonadales bacterium]|nr:hypothetical protein [Candidatus Saccharimonadales bacterium]
MVFHNRPGGYSGIEPLDEHVYTSTHARELSPPVFNDGLYYRGDVDVDPDELKTVLLENPFASILDYQRWAETAWKEEQGTFAAVERFGEKLREEVGELATAMFTLEREGVDTPESRNEVLLECGDVLWCVTTLACCVNADIDSGLKVRLFRYLMGAQYFKSSQVIKPRWRQPVADLAVKFEQAYIRDVDEVIEEGFEPLRSPVMNVYDADEEEDDEIGHFGNLAGWCLQLINGSRAQFGRLEDGYTENMTGSSFDEQSRQAGELIGQIYLEIAFIANRSLGLGLEEVIRANVEKLLKRVASNTLDKDDGDRPEGSE